MDLAIIERFVKMTSSIVEAIVDTFPFDCESDQGASQKYNIRTNLNAPPSMDSITLTITILKN